MNQWEVERIFALRVIPESSVPFQEIIFANIIPVTLQRALQESVFFKNITCNK